MHTYVYTHTIYRAFPLGIWAVHLDLEWRGWGRSSQQRRPLCRCLWGGSLCKALPADLEFKLVSSDSTYLSIWTSESGCPILFTAFCIVINPVNIFFLSEVRKLFRPTPRWQSRTRNCPQVYITTVRCCNKSQRKSLQNWSESHSFKRGRFKPHIAQWAKA